MSEHQQLPDPFFDATGFPLCLTQVRPEIGSRGGLVTGSGLSWRVTHPDPEIPDIGIDFYDEGEVVVSRGPANVGRGVLHRGPKMVGPWRMG
jgi:hypothetical protein